MSHAPIPMAEVGEPPTAELLRRYARTGDQAAFAAVVRAHTDLVYSVAMRQMAGDRHLARDVVQQTFALLASKASAVATRCTPAGWLYRTTVFTARTALRGQRSRRRWENAAAEEAQLMNLPPSGPPASDPSWDAVRPELDRALERLSGRERDTVLLRYYEGRSYADIGRTLRISEDAARMRVDRALAKLGRHLRRRWAAPSAAALAALLSDSAAIAAPPGLAAEASAVAAGTPAAAWLVLMTTTKALIGLSVGLGLAIAGAWYETKQAGIVGREIAIMDRSNALLRAASAYPGRREPAQGSRAAGGPPSHASSPGWNRLFAELEDPAFADRFVANQRSQFELNTLPAFAYFKISAADRESVLGLQEKRLRDLLDINLAARSLGLRPDDPSIRWMTLRSNVEMFTSMESLTGLNVYSVGGKAERLRGVSEIDAALYASNAPLSLEQASALSDAMIRNRDLGEGDAAKVLTPAQMPAYGAYVEALGFRNAVRTAQRTSTHP